MTTSKHLVFFGTEDFSLPTLEALIGAGYDISYVVTKPDTRRGRGKQLESPVVKKCAQQRGIPVLQPAKLSEIRDELLALQPVAGVLVAYGKIIPQSILDIFRPGIINLHPSKLPRYRGPAPIENVIKNGDNETAISIMRLSAGMDEGPIYSQTLVPLDVLDTTEITRPKLYEKLARDGAEQLLSVLPNILSGTLEPKPQQTDDVSITTMISKQDGRINPITDTAEQVERSVRAYLGFPKSRLRIDEYDVIVTSAKVVDSQLEHELVVTCKNDSYLLVESLVAPSGKSMTGSAYLRGLRTSR